MSFRFSSADYYVLARALARLPVEDIDCSPPIKFMVEMFNPSDPDMFNKFTDALRGLGVLQDVLAIDPKQPLPKKKAKSVTVYIPPLPSSAQLTDAALKQAETSGLWLNDFVRWASGNSPETPIEYIVAGGVWLVGLAVARRCYVHVHEKVYPHLYMIWVGRSGVAKSTGLKQVSKLAYSIMPHMLLPEENSPESLIENLAGRLPDNLNMLSAKLQERVQAGVRFAAQRAILVDEAQSLLGASKKDYMQGLSDWLLKLYDARDENGRSTRSRGLVYVRNAGLSILGATTPAAMARALTYDQWQTGEFARMVFIYPLQKVSNQSHVIYVDPSEELMHPLRQLHNRLPKPLAPTDEAYGEWGEVGCLFDDDAYNAYKRYDTAVRKDMIDTPHVDERLKPNYIRFPTQALKVAINLACMDWSLQVDKARPRITLGHWARAQQIVETWRASLHTMMPMLDESEDTRHQNRLIAELFANPEGSTISSLSRSTGIPTTKLRAALEVLIESGEVESVEKLHSGAGRPTVLYKAVGGQYD
ncbi:MAG: DUF3987 domain-containing protein [Phototrophicaceae bacterium]